MHSKLCSRRADGGDVVGLAEHVFKSAERRARSHRRFRRPDGRCDRAPRRSWTSTPAAGEAGPDSALPSASSLGSLDPLWTCSTQAVIRYAGCTRYVGLARYWSWPRRGWAEVLKLSIPPEESTAAGTPFRNPRGIMQVLADLLLESCLSPRRGRTGPLDPGPFWQIVPNCAWSTARNDAALDAATAERCLCRGSLPAPARLPHRGSTVGARRSREALEELRPAFSARPTSRPHPAASSPNDAKALWLIGRSDAASGRSRLLG